MKLTDMHLHVYTYVTYTTLKFSAKDNKVRINHVIVL